MVRRVRFSGLGCRSRTRGDEKSGKWGFIDRSGKYAITPQWDHASRFSGGLSIVRNGDIVTGKERVIDKRGSYVSDLEAGVMLPCENGMTLVGINVSWDDRGVNRHFGFVDKSGKYAIDPKFDDAFCFSEGTAAVRSIVAGDMFISSYIDTSEYIDTIVCKGYGVNRKIFAGVG